jgi:uncharacterized protein involved in outer membrane biogenesis
MNLNVKQRIGLVLALLVGGLLLVAVYALSTIDTTRILKVVSQQVKANTGRDLAIRGPVSIKLIPHLAVVAEQVSLSNPSWASDANMITAKQVSFDLQWAPLFSKRIEIENITLDQVQLVLQAAPATTKVAGNWIFDSTSGNTESNDQASSSFGFDLSGMHLNQASLIFKNSGGAVVDTLLVKDFNNRREGNQIQLQAVMNWNNLPLTLKGSTDLWVPLIDNWGEKPTDFALDLNLGINKQTAQVKGYIKFSPKSNPVVDLKVNAAALDLQAITATLSQGTKSAVADKSGSSNRVFSAEPLPFDALPVWQGAVQADLGTLTLPDGIKLESFNASITATADDALILKPLSFKIGSGQVSGDSRINAIHSAKPEVRVRGYATGFNFGHVMTQLGKGNLFSGGPTQAAFNISSRGRSPSALAASANGALQVSVGQATVSNSLVNLGGDFLLSVANVINPLRKSSESTQLQCMVAYLPVKNGLVQINQSVGMQTDRLDLTLDGQVNLGPETMLINIQPKEKSGLTTGVNPAGLVQITGTLSNPSMGINKAGVVKQATGVGLAIVTGGISLLAQNAAGVVSRSSPCDNVLHPWPQVAGGLLTSP